MTPVFPPARGGIETLGHRVVTELPSFDFMVVTLEAAGWEAYDRAAPYPVRRAANEPQGGRSAILGLNALAARAIRSDPVDVVVAMHIRAAPAAALWSRVRGVPYVLYLHAKEVREYPALASFAVHHAAATVVVSRYTESLGLAAGADPARVHRIPPGVDVEALAPAPWPRPPRLVTVSRLEDRNKGHDTVLRALPRVLAAVPEARWTVVGDGPLRPALEQEAEALGVRHAVDFLGAVGDAERDAAVGGASAYVMPTRLPADGRGGEGFGIVYLEAAARATPVVATAVPGVVDSVADGRSGTLVPAPATPDSVADAVIALLGDPARAAALGASARGWAEEFAWPTIGARLDALLTACADAPPARPARLANLNRLRWPIDLLRPPRASAPTG